MLNHIPKSNLTKPLIRCHTTLKQLNYPGVVASYNVWHRNGASLLSK